MPPSALVEPPGFEPGSDADIPHPVSPVKLGPRILNPRVDARIRLLNCDLLPPLRRKRNPFNRFWRYPEIVLTAAAYLVTTIGYPVYRHAAVAFNELAVWIE